DHAQDVHSQRLNELRLAAGLGEDRRVRAGTHHLGRMRIERDHHRGDAGLPGPLDRVGDDLLVSTVDTVEDPDGHHGTAPPGWSRLDAPPPLHAQLLSPAAGARTTSGRARPSSSATIAMTRPSGPNTAYGPIVPTARSRPPWASTRASSASASRRGNTAA